MTTRMKRLFPFIIVTLLPVFLCACVKDIIMDAGDNPQVVVECVLREEPTQTLFLAYTKGASRAAAPDLPEAEAVLTDLTTGLSVGHFERISDGTWQLAYAAIPTHRYRLDVAVPGQSPIWAEQTMPDMPPVEIVDITREESYDYPGYEDAFGILYSSSFSCAVWAFGLNYNSITEELVPAEQLCTDYPYVDNFNLTGETYFHETTTPMMNNMVLRVYSVLSGAVSIHRRFLRFPKSNSSLQHYFDVEGLAGLRYYDDMWRPPLPTECVLFFAALSDEYDQYLCEALQDRQAQESADITSIYTQRNLYTNIQGGLGIFGAVTKMPIRWRGLYKSELIPEDGQK